MAKNNKFPTLISDRIRLREPNITDLDAYHALVSRIEITRFSNWPDAPKKNQTERSLKWMCESFAKGKGCAWIIEDNASEKLLGGIRFNSIDKQSKSAELGYELDPLYWQRGIATEAVRTVVRCGFDIFSLNRLEAWTLPGNPGSDRVLEKSGFVFEGILRQKAWFKNAFHDFRMFSRLANEVR